MAKVFRRGDPRDGFESRLVQAAEFARSPGYLGDAQVVTDLMGGFVGEVCDAVEAGDKARCYAAINRHAEIFSGGHAGEFTVIPEWHDRDHLGLYLAERVGVDPNQALVDILACTFSRFARELFAIMDEVAQGAPDEQWQWKVDALKETYRDLLLGIYDMTHPDEESEPEEPPATR